MTSSREKIIEAIAALNVALQQMSMTSGEEGPQNPADILQLCWGAKVSKDFRDSVLWIQAQLGLSGNYLMACMAFETGTTFSPSIKNPHSSATGLIQFMSATAKQLGTTTEALAQMSAVRQLSYVYRYFKAFGNNLSHWDLADTYMAILLPSMIGKGMDERMSWSQQGYAANKGLDLDRDGTVTKREACKRVYALYDMGMLPENRA